MTLVLRQVTRRVSGAEIVREKVLPTDTARIGRGADCEIRLPDLAVSLHHATLTANGPGRVSAVSAGREPFGVDGRFVTRADVDVGRAPRLTFGDHILTLSAGDGGNILINLALAEPTEGEASSGVPAGGVISKARVFGRRRIAWALGLGIVALCLLWPLAAFHGHLKPRIDPDQQWSTGPLSQAHAFLEDDCQSCHQEAFVAVTDASCKTCHSGDQTTVAMAAAAASVRRAGSTDTLSFVRDHAPRRRILWGTPPPDDFSGQASAWFRRAFNIPEQRCASCHVEHVGNPASTRPPEPIPTLTPTQTCVQCHAGMTHRLKDTDLADTPSWTRHPNFRPTLPGPNGPTRVSLNSPPREASGLTFPHRLHLAPGGGPARMAQTLGERGYGAALTCANCHRPDADGKGFAPLQMERDCASCHSLAFATPGGVRQLPHGEPGLVVAALSAWQGRGPVAGGGSARRRPGQIGEGGPAAGGPPAGASAVTTVGGAFGPRGACFDCHTIFRTPTLRFTPVRLPGDFLSRGAFDHSVREHRVDRLGQPACARCHAAATSGTATDLLLPSVSECVECHGQTTARSPTPAPADCETCHS
ncbi:FHA domain-containing protein, partial [uncultured Brevundimonas sp.]|uniref:FHA domain-containing protein n=1 Tax=uncultured Brevundimonas sp. TaxID=213418 RepID=UPI0026302988